MALYLSLLPILITALVVSGNDDDLPFNTTGLTPIYVHKESINSRHYHGHHFNGHHYNGHRPSGSSCNSVTSLSPGTSSVFTSPRFPRAYPPNQSCQYVFKSLDYSCNIQIECNFFQLPWSYYCSSSSSRSTNLFMKWGSGRNEWRRSCGSNIPSTVVSSSFWAYAIFCSNWWSNWSYRGFRCTASTICPTTTTPLTTTSTPTTTATTTSATSTIIFTTTTVPTTVAPTTAVPTNPAPTTAAPTTMAPTTAAATTVPSTTVAPTTAAPTTGAATTAAPITAGPTTSATTTTAATTVVTATTVATTTTP